MNKGTDTQQRAQRLFGWLGLACLFLIIPIKAERFVSEAGTGALLVGIAPSLLGPAGLLFLILSGSGKLSRLTLPQVTCIVALIAMALEFVQLLPRPGILAMVYYTFDWLDVLASVLSVGIGYLTALVVRKTPHDSVKG